MFGVKLVLQSDPKFLSSPFVPAAFCSVADKTGEYFIAGYGKVYKRVGPINWRPM